MFTIVKVVGAGFFGLAIVWAFFEVTNVPKFKVPASVLHENNGQFVLRDDWVFITEAYDTKGRKMTHSELKEYAHSGGRYQIVWWTSR